MEAQIRTALTTSSFPLVTSAFLASLSSSSTTPQAAIAAAKAHILAGDLSRNQDLDPSLASLPLGIDNTAVEETRLPRAVHVQVLDVENLSLSRWAQVEELEAIERGEGTRGRQVIRVTTETDDDGVTESQAAQPQRPAPRAGVSTAGPATTHRLVLQDCKGKKIFAVELKRMERVGVGKTCIGEKILLRAGAVVARGVLLLTPETCVLLGGKVDAWHKEWTDGRLERLKGSVGSDRPV